LNKDPYKYQAITILQENIGAAVDIDNSKKKQNIQEAKNIMDKIIEKYPKDPSLLFLRGLIQFYLHQFYEALIDLDAVIDLEDDPSARQFLARGRCHACLSMF